eukprot:1569372-Amphidinium_carterae.1
MYNKATKGHQTKGTSMKQAKTDYSTQTECITTPRPNCTKAFPRSPATMQPSVCMKAFGTGHATMHAKWFQKWGASSSPLLLLPEWPGEPWTGPRHNACNHSAWHNACNRSA